MPPSAPPPPALHGYVVEHLLAQGGMARVYLARQEALQRLVAIKVLDPRLASADSIEHFTISLERFFREGTLIAAINQSNVVHVYDVGSCVDGLPYIVMEYLPGGTLRNRMQSAMAPEQALGICRQIAQGLAVAHAQGIVHRDIKPSNILFRSDNTPVLTDFGIAKQQGSQDITRGGSTLGTPYYLSPEQALGQAVDGRADLYGLGVMLYEMLTGKKPFQGDSTMNTLLLHIQTPPPPLPPELSAYQPLLNRLLAKQPEQRYPDAEALIDAIDRTRALQALAAEPQSWWQAPWVMGLLGVVLLGTVIVGAAYLLRLSRPVELVNPPEPARLLLHVQTVTVAPTSVSVAPATEVQDGVASVLATMPEVMPIVVPPALDAEGWALWPQVSQPFLPQQTAWDAALLLALASPAPVLPQQISVKPSAVTLASLLEAGQQALAEGRLTQPPQANAQHYFRQVLKLDAKNAAAQQGLQQIGDRFFRQAQVALQRNQHREASKLVREGLQVQPKHGKLRTLQTLLQTQGEL